MPKNSLKYVYINNIKNNRVYLNIQPYFSGSGENHYFTVNSAFTLKQDQYHQTTTKKQKQNFFQKILVHLLSLLFLQLYIRTTINFNLHNPKHLSFEKTNYWVNKIEVEGLEIHMLSY